MAATGKITINYINHDGGGFAEGVEVTAGTTVKQFFELKMGSRSPSDYLIKVNRDGVPGNHVLKEQDSVSVTPRKVQGA